jgi:hypothetical protein
MKKLILLLPILFFIGTGCKKKKDDPKPDPTTEPYDAELETSKNTVFANQLAIEVEQLASCLGEGQFYNGNPFAPDPSSGGVYSYTVLSSNHYQITYSGSVTCMDGRVRNGVVDLYYASSPVSYSANALRDPGFVATVFLTSFSVDGWSITANTPLIITNLNSFSWSPASTNLIWKIEGDLNMTNLTDASKNMSWKGTYYKTLTNTTDPSVFAPTKLLPINWMATYNGSTTVNPGAQVSYTGSCSGKSNGSTNYTFTVGTPVKIDFGCAPGGTIAAITGSNGTTYIYSQWHPFTGGKADMNSSNVPDKRTIDFESGCDNSGKVYIRFDSYSIDFRRQ